MMAAAIARCHMGEVAMFLSIDMSASGGTQLFALNLRHLAVSLAFVNRIVRLDILIRPALFYPLLAFCTASCSDVGSGHITGRCHKRFKQPPKQISNTNTSITVPEVLL